MDQKPKESAITRKLGSPWSSIIESSVIMHFDRAMVHFTTRMQCKLPSRIIQSPNRITHPLPYNSARAHSATVATQVQGLGYLLPAHASRTRSTRPHLVAGILTVRHESPINRQQFRRAPSPKLIRDEVR